MGYHLRESIMAAPQLNQHALAANYLKANNEKQ